MSTMCELADIAGLKLGFRRDWVIVLQLKGREAESDTYYIRSVCIGDTQKYLITWKTSSPDGELIDF